MCARCSSSKGRAGVVENGQTLRAGLVVPSVNPRLLFLQMLYPRSLEPRFRRRIEAWRCRSGTFRMNVASGSGIRPTPRRSTAFGSPGCRTRRSAATPYTITDKTELREVIRRAREDGSSERRAIISRTNADHGSTIAAASLTGLASMHAIPGIPIPDIHRAPAPFRWAEGGDLTPAALGRQAAPGIEETILRVGPEIVAAFIGEPVMGARAASSCRRRATGPMRSGR